MALILADRVQETTTTTGTGAVSLAGAVSNFRAFSSVLSDQDTTYYALVGSTVWEIGLGTYNTSGNTLSRTTVYATSSGTTSPLTLGAGTYNIWIDAAATPMVFKDANGTIPSPTFSGTISGQPTVATTSSLAPQIVTVDFGTTGNEYNIPTTATQTYGSVATTAATGTGSVATLTFAAQTIAIPVGTTIVVAGVTPLGYNGTFVVTASTTTTVSYANSTTAAQSVAGTVTPQLAIIGFATQIASNPISVGSTATITGVVATNATIATTAASSTASTATVTFAAQSIAPPVGSVVTIAGVTPTAYNGTYIVTASTTTSVTYATGANPGVQIVAGTIAFNYNGVYTIRAATQAAIYITSLASGPQSTAGVYSGGNLYGEFSQSATTTLSSALFNSLTYLTALPNAATQPIILYSQGISTGVNSFGDEYEMDNFTVAAQPIAGATGTTSPNVNLYITATPGPIAGIRQIALKLN
jgi:hypothetical protein